MKPLCLARIVMQSHPLVPSFFFFSFLITAKGFEFSRPPRCVRTSKQKANGSKLNLREQFRAEDDFSLTSAESRETLSHSHIQLGFTSPPSVVSRVHSIKDLMKELLLVFSPNRLTTGS